MILGPNACDSTGHFTAVIYMNYYWIRVKEVFMIFRHTYDRGVYTIRKPLNINAATTKNNLTFFC